MKKLLAILVVLCMVLGMMPTVGFADATALKAIRTAYFGPGDNLTATNGRSDTFLIAANNDTQSGWSAPDSFTDSDGTVTTQSVSGIQFINARNGIVAFTMPEDLDVVNTAKVTLSFKVRRVKQVSKGARIAVYGNSVDTAWDTSTNKSVFGVSGSDSGLANLPLLGLTTALEHGENNTSEIIAEETVTLSSKKLLEYMCEMKQAGAAEVTFRLAMPAGGVWVYDKTSATPPTLTIEEGKITTATVKTVYMDGEFEAESSSELVENLVSGSEYEYMKTIESVVTKGEDIYIYSAEKSTLKTVIAEDGSSELVIYYEKYTDSNSFNGYELDDEGAWCWFADPRSISYKNEEGTIDVTIIGYIDVHGSIKATQINNITNKVDEVLIRTNLQPDDHNNPTFLVLPDERIVVFYSRHTDEACFWYRVTREKGDITTFGEEKCLVTSANTTYPSPFILSDDPDHIYLTWRGIGWHPTIAKISIPDENGDMEFTYGPYQMVKSTGARPYAKYASNGKDKIFMSYTTGHPDNEDPNWLYFNQIDIATMTLEDINGNTMSTIASGPLNVNKSNTNQTNIVDRTSGVRNWLWQVAVAKDGTPVIANVRINGAKSSHDYYYVKWNGTSWVKTFLTNAGGKFHPSNTEYCYSGGMSIDADNPNVMYCSKPAPGVFGNVFEIFKYTMSPDGTSVINTEQITHNSRKNNVRPWAIPGSEGDDLRVLWMSGDYDYWMVNKNYPAGYPTAAMANAPLPTEDVVLYDAVVNETFDDIGGAFVSTRETNTWIMFDGKLYDNQTYERFDGEFTVSADIYLDGDYEGKIFEASDGDGWVKLAVEKRATRYADDATDERARLVIYVGDNEFVSPNVYGNSDDWKYYSTGTTGDYYFTEYDEYQNLTLTYDGEYITLYHNGLIEIKEKAVCPGIDTYMALGEFDGYCENFAVYSRALNHDEIKTLNENEYEVKYPGVEGTDVIELYYMTTSNFELNRGSKTIPPRSNHVAFYPEEILKIDGEIYLLEKTVAGGLEPEAYAYYKKMHDVGENLVPDGSFEDENGNFSWGTWQTPKSADGYNNGYFKDICSDWFYVVNGDTNSAALYDKNNIAAADKYVLGTRWNDGVQGLCSMANFIPVEAGKTYRVSYDYKHRNAGTNSAYISTTFVKDKNFGYNESGNNTPVDVTTDWQTNEFIITAPEDGYIYFHFSWVGSGGSTDTGNNQGNGPYWYFDNFEVYQMDRAPIEAQLSHMPNTTYVSVENVSDNRIENIKIYVVSEKDGIVTKAESITISLDAHTSSGILEFKNFVYSDNAKVYIWNEKMQPLHHALEY